MMNSERDGYKLPVQGAAEKWVMMKTIIINTNTVFT
jgi:hypothetical protein